jgi:hypothetical protein
MFVVLLLQSLNWLFVRFDSDFKKKKSTSGQKGLYKLTLNCKNTLLLI